MKLIAYPISSGSESNNILSTCKIDELIELLGIKSDDLPAAIGKLSLDPMFGDVLNYYPLVSPPVSPPFSY